MKNFLANALSEQRRFWSRKTATRFLLPLLLLAAALVIQHFAYQYIDTYAVVTPVQDLFLDHLPAVNLDIFIVQGALISTLLVLMFFFRYPNYLPFSISTLSLFLIIRSFFISLTHLGANLHQVTLNTGATGFFLYNFLYNAKNDFFFSGHVGAAFLFALLFWEKPFWRNMFLAITVIFAASMLLAHMHYSIDVFAAPFITYAIFSIAKAWFKQAYSLTKKEFNVTLES
jgi:hypothetical protein